MPISCPSFSRSTSRSLACRSGTASVCSEPSPVWPPPGHWPRHRRRPPPVDSPPGFYTLTRARMQKPGSSVRALLLLASRKRGGHPRALAVEFGGLLEGVADPHHHGLVERFAGDLKGERQSVLETDRHRKGRAAGKIVRGSIRGPSSQSA